jgi:hypothetical protein
MAILAEEQSLEAKGLPMRCRLDSQAGPDVPDPALALQQIQQQLAAHQQAWAERLTRDPAAFAQLEPQIHEAFGQLADRLAASLLAQAARQQVVAEAAKKK